MVAKALTASCTLAQNFKKPAPSSVEQCQFEQWRKLAVQCNKALAAQERKLHAMQTEYETKLEMLKAEMRAELIDREGNAARVADRQRSLIESEYKLDRAKLSSYDRITNSVAVLESTLDTLTSVTTPGPGTSAVLAR